MTTAGLLSLPSDDCRIEATFVTTKRNSRIRRQAVTSTVDFTKQRAAMQSQILFKKLIALNYSGSVVTPVTMYVCMYAFLLKVIMRWANCLHCWHCRKQSQHFKQNLDLSPDLFSFLSYTVSSVAVDASFFVSQFSLSWNWSLGKYNPRRLDTNELCWQNVVHDGNKPNDDDTFGREEKRKEKKTMENVTGTAD